MDSESDDVTPSDGVAGRREEESSWQVCHWGSVLRASSHLVPFLSPIPLLFCLPVNREHPTTRDVLPKQVEPSNTGQSSLKP